jgi:rhodanese-related sulfurtransferase
MTRRLSNPLAQTAVIIAIATVLALAANAMASRQRKLILKGWYPNATTVPVRVETPPQPVAVAETTTAMSPAPGAAPIEVPTSTIERPAGLPETKAAAPATATSATATVAPVKPAPAASTAAEGGGAPLDLTARFQPHPDKAYVEIGGDDVAVLHANGALFLDARRTSIFEQGHIAGARTMSVWESDVDEKVNALFNERSDPREQLQPIVIYCSGGDCEDSHMLAQKLWGAQFNNIYVYKDGFPDWQKRGGKVRSGATP